MKLHSFHDAEMINYLGIDTIRQHTTVQFAPLKDVAHVTYSEGVLRVKLSV